MGSRFTGGTIAHPERTIRSHLPERVSSGASLACLYMLGLLLNNFPPLVVSAGGTTILRPDWVLSIPLFAYTMRRSRVDLGPPAIAAFVFLLATVVSVLVNPLVDPFTFVTMFSQLIYAVGLFVVLSSLRFSTEQVRVIFRFWLLLLVAASAFGLLQALVINVAHIETEAFPLRGFRAGIGYIRPSSVFREPSYFADTLMTGIAILLPPVVRADPVYFTERGQNAIVALLLGTLFVAGSMGGYISLVFGFVIIWVLLAPLRGSLTQMVKVSAPLVGTIAVAIELISGKILGTIWVRMYHFMDLVSGTPRGGSIAVRGTIYILNLEVWSTSPLFGSGLGQHQSKTASYLSRFNALPNLTTFDITSLVTGQNGAWFAALVHTGIVGLITFSLIWIASLRTLLSAAYDESRFDQTVILSLTCLTIVLFVGWIYEFSFIHPSRWALIGLAYGCAISTK